jgi:hypothetical protein
MKEHDAILSRLDALTDNLTTLPDLVSYQFPRAELIEYQMDSGVCLGIGLLNQNEVSVQKAFMPIGSKFPRHVH